MAICVKVKKMNLYVCVGKVGHFFDIKILTLFLTKKKCVFCSLKFFRLLSINMKPFFRTDWFDTHFGWYLE